MKGRRFFIIFPGLRGPFAPEALPLGTVGNSLSNFDGANRHSLLMTPYRHVTPVEGSWCPTAYDSLRISTVFGGLYVVAAISFFLFPPFLYPNAWTLRLTAIGCILALHLVLYAVLGERSVLPVMTLRMWAMRKACQPQDAACEAESDAEIRLGEAFEEMNLPVHLQQRVKNRYGRGYEYRTDFAYLDPSCGLRIDIEVDGRFKEGDDDIQRRMANRDQWFSENGWHVLRFHAGDCYRRPASCATSVIEYIRVAEGSHRAALDRLRGGNHVAR